jgi:hypothetical protein
LLFSDIEGSTQLLTRLGAAYADALGSEPYDSAFGNEALTGWTKRRPTGRNGPGLWTALENWSVPAPEK